jgi:hypothetical protein
MDTLERWAETTKRHVRRRYPVTLPHAHEALDVAREQAEICCRIHDSAPATSAPRRPPS